MHQQAKSTFHSWSFSSTLPTAWAKSHPTRQPRACPHFVIASMSNFCPLIANSNIKHLIKGYKFNFSYRCNSGLLIERWQRRCRRALESLQEYPPDGVYVHRVYFARWSIRPLPCSRVISVARQQRTGTKQTNKHFLLKKCVEIDLLFFTLSDGKAWPSMTILYRVAVGR